MKPLALSLLLLLSPYIASAAAVDLPAADQEAVKNAALDYAEGWYTGNRARMERSLHDQLAKRAYLKNEAGTRELDLMTKERLLAANHPNNAQRYANEPKRADVEILDGFGNVATVKLTMDGWVDYMHVARTETGEWKIVNVLWELTK